MGRTQPRTAGAGGLVEVDADRLSESFGAGRIDRDGAAIGGTDRQLWRTGARQVASDEQGADDNDQPKPPRKGRPSLRVIK